MPFRTKIDYSNNRQIKQFTANVTHLSGGTSFGVPFSALTSGPDLTTSAITQTYSLVASTFSGNNSTTIFTWYTPSMSLGEIYLSAITPSTSASTQNTGAIFTANTTTIIDGNTVALDYTGISYDISVISMIDLGGGDYSGTVVSTTVDELSAGTLDYTGRTIWVDVSGITRTQDLIVTNNPQIGYVLTCIDSEGKVSWQPSSGGTSSGDVYTTGATLIGTTAYFDRNDALSAYTLDLSALTSTGSTSYWSASTGINAIVIVNSNSLASGDYALAEGFLTTAGGSVSHSEGGGTKALGDFGSHAEGYLTTAAGGYGSHAEGSGTTATGDATAAHVEGIGSIVTGDAGHAEGYYTTATADYGAHAQGSGTTAGAWAAHAEGVGSVASGIGAHAEGYFTNAFGNYSHAEGYLSYAFGDYGHAEGNATSAFGLWSHAEGFGTTASGFIAHAEGNNTKATGNFSHSEGSQTSATTQDAHAEGNSTLASGGWAHAEGSWTVASGGGAHAEGEFTTASASGAHSEGQLTTAIGTASHAEGSGTTASGRVAHSEGEKTTASGKWTHAGGFNSIASGDASFVHGTGSTASGAGTIVLGNNITGADDNTVYVHDLYITGLISTDPLATNGSGKVIAGVSDARLKDNIETIGDTLTLINKLRPVSFKYKPELDLGNATHFGLIAQEVQTVFPELVKPRPGDEKHFNVSYIELIPLLVKAINELSQSNITTGGVYLETQTILAEDNDIQLNFSGNQQTSIGGGIRVLHAMGQDKEAAFITDEQGNWITNNDIKAKALTIPYYTPSSSNDVSGNEGNITRDDDYIYIKTNSKWKRTKLEEF